MIKLLLIMFLVGVLVLLGLTWLFNRLWWVFLDALNEYLQDKQKSPGDEVQR